MDNNMNNNDNNVNYDNNDNNDKNDKNDKNDIIMIIMIIIPGYPLSHALSPACTHFLSRSLSSCLVLSLFFLSFLA